jgi:hypothetical protein
VWVLAHKIRQALGADADGIVLDGIVEIDGAVFGGHIRPTNKVEDRIDRRLAKHQTGKRRVVVVTGQRKGRTLPFVVKHESDGVEIARRRIAPKAQVHADEASHWDALHAYFEAHRINHSEAYSLNGICTNQAESYFSRLRRWSGASIIMSARSTYTPMPRMRLGSKITAAWTMARCTPRRAAGAPSPCFTRVEGTLATPKLGPAGTNKDRIRIATGATTIAKNLTIMC